MKKILLPICAVFVIFIGFQVYTNEACACFKPSDIVKGTLLQLRDEIKKTSNDFSNVCTSTSTKVTFDELSAKYQIQPLCQAEKNNFSLQTKLPNHKTFCVDVDSSKEGLALNEGVTSCD